SDFARVIEAALGPALLTHARIESLTPSSVRLADGKTVHARAIIDGRGMRPTERLSLGYQTFLGQELRLAALEDRTDADLALGRHGELVAELQALVEEHPLRERLRARLMLALYRSGRQAEALDVYRDGRRRLVDELGVEPGPELRELEAAILRHDPALRAGSVSRPEVTDGRTRTVARSSGSLPVPGTSFVGRRQELG
ncbi:MAG: BTAD domain-containing putative transcriptional regulator, partial [Gammaproteobacteria bacterium]